MYIISNIDIAVKNPNIAGIWYGLSSCPFRRQKMIHFHIYNTRTLYESSEYMNVLLGKFIIKFIKFCTSNTGLEGWSLTPTILKYVPDLILICISSSHYKYSFKSTQLYWYTHGILNIFFQFHGFIQWFHIRFVIPSKIFAMNIVRANTLYNTLGTARTFV